MSEANVSVVMPCYNSSATVERAVLSIYNQTLRPAEVILVDDCSIDDTLIVLEGLREKLPEGWVKILSMDKNRGAGSARNYGWSIASGEYVAFLDADDSWHPQKVEIQYGWMISNPDVALTGHLYSVQPGKDSFEKLSSIDMTVRKVNYYSMLFSNHFSTPTVMLKKDIDFRFRDGKRYSEDYLLWLEIILSGKPCYKIESILAFLYKPPFGVAGLSSNFKEMEKGELDNYRALLVKKDIGFFIFLLCCSVSIGKFFIRILRR